MPPCKRQRALPGSALTWQRPPARVLAPQRSRPLRRFGKDYWWNREHWYPTSYSLCVKSKRNGARGARILVARLEDAASNWCFGLPLVTRPERSGWQRKPVRSKRFILCRMGRGSSAVQPFVITGTRHYRARAAESNYPTGIASQSATSLQSHRHLGVVMSGCSPRSMPAAA